MAWKPKTVMGKLLKGAAMAGGSVVAMYTGNKIITNILQRTGKAKGHTALSLKSGNSVVSLSGTLDRIKEGAARLVTGKTKELRGKVNQAREEARELIMKQKTAEKLVSLGKGAAEARALAGLDPEELPEMDGKPIKKNNNMILFGGLALGAILLLSKIGK